MNSRYTLIIVLLAIAAGIFAYTQRDAKPVDYSHGMPTATPAPFLDLDKDKLQEVEVSTQDGKVVLKRAAGGWEVEGKGPASETVGSTLERLAKPEVLRDLGTEAKPEDYGLATASMTVTLKLSGGESTVVQLGDKHPIDPQYYVRKAGDKRIVILSSTDWDSLKDWIANAPLAPTATPVAEGTPAAEGVDGVALPTTDAAGEDSGAVPDAAGEVAPAVSAPPDDAAPGPTAASPTRP
ncbi:MAG TPA: DUF4340 domain-containing protein [Anaerolineae bacterium]|jgi:hypothetical protein|nr:DUF4340 domain-containing protein [Ardenticatenia bacterium]HQZ70094.1 DUF4340 domain-containing protein [Anaerolineae bacterium]HRA19189.1 DUF4340 domain-containing protein [Anaerolineae bacterium]